MASITLDAASNDGSSAKLASVNERDDQQQDIANGTDSSPKLADVDERDDQQRDENGKGLCLFCCSDFQWTIQRDIHAVDHSSLLGEFCWS